MASWNTARSRAMVTALARLPTRAFPVHQHRRGKYDEKLLRARHTGGSLDVVSTMRRLRRPRRRSWTGTAMIVEEVP